MTEEQLEKEAKTECFMLTVNTIGIDQRDVELAYILGRKKSIKQIEVLEKSCNEIQVLLDNQIKVTYKVVEENNTLKEDIKSKDLALEDFAKWSDKKLNKAKEILRMVIESYKHEERFTFEKDLMKAEEFLKEE